MFGKLAKNKKIFSNVDFTPAASQKNKSSQRSINGLLSDAFENGGEDYGNDSRDNDEKSILSGLSRFSRRSRNSHGSPVVKGGKTSQKNKDAKRGAVKRTSSQAVVPRSGNINGVGFGTIDDVTSSHHNDDSEGGSVCVDPFSIKRRPSASSVSNSSTWENLIRSPQLSLQSKSIPATMSGSLDLHESAESLDLFGCLESNSPRHDSPINQAKNFRAHDSFDQIEPTVIKKERRRILKGTKQTSRGSSGATPDDYRNDHMSQKARELEEIGNIGSSSELCFNPDGDELSEEDELDYFEDAEASSYYSGSSHDDEEEEEEVTGLAHQNRYANSSPTRKRNGSPPTRQPPVQTARMNPPVAAKPKFQPQLPPNHFAAFVDHGDWRVLGKNANKIRKRPTKKRIDEESDSDTNSNASSSSSSSGSTAYGIVTGDEVDDAASSSDDRSKLYSDTDDESLTAKKETPKVKIQPLIRRNITRMTSCQLRRWDGFRQQVEALVKETMPEQADQIDKLLEQFAGRESELIQTLEKLTERACHRTNTAGVHRSRKMRTTRLTQAWQSSEAVAHIAAACTIDEGVSINTDFWKEDTSVYSNDYLYNASKQELESFSHFEEVSEESSYYTEEESSKRSESESPKQRASESDGCYYTDEESASSDDNDSYFDDQEDYSYNK